MKREYQGIRDWIEPLAEFLFLAAAFVAGSLLLIGFRMVM
jgi:hypothetical protein